MTRASKQFALLRTECEGISRSWRKTRLTGWLGWLLVSLGLIMAMHRALTPLAHLTRGLWTPLHLRPAVMLDARHGVTAAVPVVNYSPNHFHDWGDSTKFEFNGVDLYGGIWLKPNSWVGANRVAVNKWTSAGNQCEYQLWYETAAAKLKFSVSPDGTEAAIVSAEIAAPATGSWAFVEFWHVDGVGLGIRSNRSTTGRAAHAGGVFAGTGKLATGGRAAGGEGYNGQMTMLYMSDQVAFTYTDETDTEPDATISADLYNGGVVPVRTDLDAATIAAATRTAGTTGETFLPMDKWVFYVSNGQLQNYPETITGTGNNGTTPIAGPRDAIATLLEGVVSTETDAVGVTLVQATEVRKPQWVPNNGQPYYRANTTVHHLRQGNDGVGDYERTTAFSGMCCAYLTSAAAEASFFSKFDTVGWSFGIDSSGRIELILRNTATTNELRVRHANAPSTGAWHTFGFSYDGSSTTAGVALYIDGALVANTEVVSNLSATILNSVGFQMFGRNGANSAILGRIAHAPAAIPGIRAGADFARYHRWMKRRNPSFALA